MESKKDNTQEEEPKFKKVVYAANDLSLGISIVAAILIGVGLGFWMKSLFDAPWLLWVGVFWGIAAAVLNIYKAYKKQVAEYDEVKDDPRRQPAKREK